MTTDVRLDRYAQALADHVAQTSAEMGLLVAYELGRELVAGGIGILDALRLHREAVDRLESELGRPLSREATSGFLNEVLASFEMAYLGFQEANAALRDMTASLEEQVAERTRQLQETVSALQATDADRRRLLARLVAAQEGERHRLADDLHDDTIQVMTAVSLRLAGLRRRVEPEGRAQLDRLEETVLGAISRLRKLVFELRPPELDREGLAAAIRLYGRESLEGLHLAVEDRLEDEPASELREVLYRIVQEALANVRKHAEAARIDVVLEDHADGIRVRLLDDGRGFDPRVLARPRPGHLGVNAMRERAEMVGGWCTIDSAPGEGTSVVVWVPARPLAG